MAEEQDEVKVDKKQQTKKESREPGEPNVLTRYFRETRGELRKVTWPTREESWRLTLIVLAVSLASALFMGVLLDTGFSKIVELLVQQVVGI